MTRGIKRTKEEIISALQKAWKEGVDLRTNSVGNTEYYWAYKVHKNFFKDWKATLEEAGIKYEELTEKIKGPEREQKKNQLLKEIAEAYKSGIDLSSIALQKAPREINSLFHRHKTYYQGKFSWENALKDAGLDPSKIVRQKRWNKEIVKQELIKRNEQNKPLYTLKLKEEEPGLYKATRRYFPNYKSALEYAGLKPGKIIRGKPKKNTTEILQKIREMYFRGENLNYTAILKGSKRLLKRTVYSAEKRFEGGWEEAVTLAGIDYTPYKKREMDWSQEKVIELIKEIKSRNEPVNASYIMEKYNALHHAALRRIGTWDKALEMAGLNPEEHRLLQKPLTKEQIISRIKKLHEQKHDLSSTGMFASKNKEIIRTFTMGNRKFSGGWEEAIESAGLNYSEIRKKRKKYSLTELFLIVKNHEAEGELMNISKLPKNIKKIQKAVLRHYKSWSEFLKASGINPALYKEKTNWKQGNGVIEYLQKNFPTGIVTGSSKDRNFSASAEKYFENIKNAVKSAGMIYSKSGKINKEMLENPENLNIIYHFNKEFLERVAKEAYFKIYSKKRAKIQLKDFVNQAYVTLIEILPKKPPKQDLREYSRPIIIKQLVQNINSNFNEVTYEKDIYFDLFKENGIENTVEDEYINKIDNQLKANSTNGLPYSLEDTLED